VADDAQLSDTDVQADNSKVEALAEFALSALAADSFGNANSLAKQAGSFGTEVTDLLDALTKPDDATYQQLVLQTITNGCTSDDLVDHFIPDLARQLGEGWCADSLSFADVSIGVSRLQQTVRRHGAREEVDGLKSPLGQRVLLVLPETEQHSLGTFIVANQMRRLGVWSQLVLGCGLDQICSLTEGQSYAMIGISVGAKNTLDQVEKMSNAIRRSGIEAPIVLGGATVTKDPNISASDFGADFIANTTDDALTFCQIDTVRTAPARFESISH